MNKSGEFKESFSDNSYDNDYGVPVFPLFVCDTIFDVQEFATEYFCIDFNSVLDLSTALYYSGQ